MLPVDPPKVEKKILPSLTIEQVEYLINDVESVRDKAIISLLTDSGLRLSELSAIKQDDINWDNRLIRVWCKGNKEALAVFGRRTGNYLRQWLTTYNPNGGNIMTIKDLGRWESLEMVQRYTRSVSFHDSLKFYEATPS